MFSPSKTFLCPEEYWLHLIPFFFFFFSLVFIGVELIYNVVLVPAVQQSESVIHISLFFSINGTNELIYRTEIESQT